MGADRGNARDFLDAGTGERVFARASDAFLGRIRQGEAVLAELALHQGTIHRRHRLRNRVWITLEGASESSPRERIGTYSKAGGYGFPNAVGGKSRVCSDPVFIPRWLSSG